MCHFERFPYLFTQRAPDTLVYFVSHKEENRAIIALALKDCTLFAFSPDDPLLVLRSICPPSTTCHQSKSHEIRKILILIFQYVYLEPLKKGGLVAHCPSKAFLLLFMVYLFFPKHGNLNWKLLIPIEKKDLICNKISKILNHKLV